MDPEAWSRAVKDVLSWSAPFLPVKLGWVLVFILIVVCAERLIRAWRSR